MKFFDRFKKKKPEVKDSPKPKQAAVKTAKEIATEKGEAYINIVSMDVDPADISNGAFELAGTTNS